MNSLVSLGLRGWYPPALACLLVCFQPALPGARGEIIVAYDGSNSPTTAAATEWLNGLTALPLGRGPGLGAGTGATFNSSGWNDEPTDYLEWGWSSSAPLNLSHLDIRYDRSTSGPAVVDIQMAVNGGAFASIFQDPAVNVNGEENLGIDLSGYQMVTAASFRLFGGSASSNSGTFDIEPIAGISPDRGIAVHGSVAAVPEPSSCALLTAASLAACGIRWRKRSHRPAAVAPGVMG